MKRIFIITIIALFGHVSLCYGLETNTHDEVNKYISRNTFHGVDFSLDSYLINHLGIQGGIFNVFDSYEVLWWIGQGGIFEDSPNWYTLYLRSANHFHNPKTDEGFSGIWGTGRFDGISSLEWSQLSTSTQSPGGHYSWHDVRDYYEKALTSTDKNDREKFFAETFRGLGQLMHLVQDLSVPEHARDDGHYLRAYEFWVRDSSNVVIKSETGEIKIRDIYNPQTGEINPGYEPIQISPSDSFNQSALGGPSKFSYAPVPIANLFDTNTYIGNNPAVTIQPNIGLSEYTNANFVSGDIIFSSNFSYPARSSVTEMDVTIPDPLNEENTTTRSYHFKSGEGDTGYLLAGVNFLVYHIKTW